MEAAVEGEGEEEEVRGLGVEEARSWEAWMILEVRNVRAVVELGPRKGAIGVCFKFKCCSSSFSAPC